MIETAGTARVCVCVLMNQPFLANIPLLRRLYSDRFTRVLFIVPFERTDDEDVITVYRGSYTHAAYVTDARAYLSEVECEFFIFVHDDVLLNPQLNEKTFPSLFPLGPRSGFIPELTFNDNELGAWCWYYGIVPKLLFPRSMLFGTGIDIDVLKNNLPNAELLREKFEAAGISYRDELPLSDLDDYDALAGLPSRILLHGASRTVEQKGLEAYLDKKSLSVKAYLFQAMLAADAATEPADRQPPDTVKLPLPITDARSFTDFYILPKALLADFAHYIGVASAANLFVEIAVPTILVAVCDNVLTARDCGHDFAFYGFQDRSSREFQDKHFLAMHPVKFSSISSSSQKDDFIDEMNAIRDRLPGAAPYAKLGEDHLGNSFTAGYLARGWHAVESWGRWSAAPSALIEFNFSAASGIDQVKLTLEAPMRSRRSAFSGKLMLNGHDFVAALKEDSGGHIEVIIPACMLRTDAMNVIELCSDHLIVPSELHSTSADQRRLGIGLRQLAFLPAVKLPSAKRSC